MMKGSKLLVLTLYCSFMWRNYACDSISDIPQRPSDATSGPNSAPVLQEEQSHKVSEKNVNKELHKVQKRENKITVSSLKTKRQSIENPDVNIPKFSETLSKERRKDSQKEIKKEFKHSDSSPIITNVGQEVKTEAESQLDEHSISPELPHSKVAAKSQKMIEPKDAVLSQSADASSITHSSQLKSEQLEIVSSQNASPSPVEVKEGVSPSSVVDSSELTEPAQHPNSEAMPSFDEWKKMMLAEQEKGGHKVPPPSPPNKKLGSQKRRRNYSSYECGAKIVASNTEAEGTSRILNEMVDEYMLNPCQAKIWFVIELCESVQASQIELANFELFSSCPKDFAVYSSDNFPTRDWVPLGIFTAAEQRILQSFPLKQEGYGKFIKIELQSYYGKEHYCPLSVVRIFGTSMVDEYEEMETLSNQPILHQEDELDRLDLPVEDNKVPTNIFGSATDAVYNIVKKAAQVLVQHQTVEGDGGDSTIEQNISETEHCKLLEDDCRKENDSRKRVSKESASDFLISATSIHHTLYHHLRHCEQCVKAPRPSYHSISEPQCRFFQAALGPVLFTSICDWFRDHHLATFSQAPVIDSKRNISNNTQKPSSPPPSVIQVIIDTNKPELHLLSTASDTTLASEKVKSFDQQTSDLPSDLNIGISDGIKIDTVIQPTKTFSAAEEGSHVDLGKMTDADASFILKSEAERSLVMESHSISEGVQVLGSTHTDSYLNTGDVLSPSTSVPPVESSSVVNDTEAVTQISEKAEDDTIPDASTITVVASTVEPSAEDFTEDLKSAEEKFTDSKDSSLKLETVIVGGTTAQKESVFIRMNNRIKSLELNMSLSSQYLQELSQRYRRQMEEMQRAFNRTIGTLNDTARKAAERDLKQQEVIGNLQSHVANLTFVVDQLVTERSTLQRRMFQVYVFLMVVQAIIMITIMSLCVRRISFMVPHQLQSSEQSTIALLRRKRRSSADSTSSPAPILPKIKKRSSSEEVLSTGSELLIVEPTPIVPLPKVRKRNKKKKNIQRSLSNPSMSPAKSSSASQGKKKKKEASSPAGIIFSHANAKSLTEIEKSYHKCENCNKDSTRNCSENSSVTSKENKRKNYSPLKNLTNGDIECHSLPVLQKAAAKEKFSFKKFLKFQKRESI